MNQEFKLIKTRFGVVEFRGTFCHVFKACKLMGYGTDSFFRIKERYVTRHITLPANIYTLPMEHFDGLCHCLVSYYTNA